jgi:hypothetical protein
MSIGDFPEFERAEAVRAFNARFGEMERALWCLSVNTRASLLAGESSPLLEEFVWTIRSWSSLVGVRKETKTLMPSVLATSMTWTPDLFEPQSDYGPGAAAYACERVGELVGRCKVAGVNRREYSLASKVLHWLMPWRVPVYDSFARSFLEIPRWWDHPQAYSKITTEIFEAARKAAGEPGWMGALPPRSPLHAFEKVVWSKGGGQTNDAIAVKDPWAVVHRLRLRCPCPRCEEYDDGWHPAPVIDARVPPKNEEADKAIKEAADAKAAVVRLKEEILKLKAGLAAASKSDNRKVA